MTRPGRYPTADFLQLPDFLDGVTPPCREVDPEIFFPLPNATGNEAKAVCRRCPVQDGCAQWAIDTGQRYGVWGGLSPEDREKLRKRRLGVVTR